LQIYAVGKDGAKFSDKDLEAKLKVMKEILEFKFKIPQNIYQSIYETIITILVTKVDLSKDFLLLKVIDILDALFEA